MERTRIPLGTYRGLRFGLVTPSDLPARVYLEGSTPRQTTLSRDHQGPRAVLNALERLANGYGSETDRVRQDLTIAKAQLRDYQARLGKPFTLDSYLAELTTLRDQLKAGFSATAMSPERREGPSVSKLAEHIKAMKAANSVEAAPQRVGQRQSTAEEPITARIRRRREAILGSDRSLITEVSTGTGSAPPQDSIPLSSAVSQFSFQQRIALQRHDQQINPRLS